MLVRRLFARPILSLASIATLALTAGAGSAVFAVANATILRPLPFPDGPRLVRVFEQPPQTTTFAARNGLSLATLVRFREQSQTLDALEGLWGRVRALGAEGDPETVPTADVTAGLFELLGSRPLVGRTFTLDEERTNAHVVVISHGLWRRKFGGDRQIVGRTVTIDREPHEVIGVMAADFEPGFVRSELWTPLDLDINTTPLGFSNFILTVGRLRAGANVTQASRESVELMRTLGRDYPRSFTGWSAFVVDLTTGVFGDQRRPIAMLALAALLLVLIGCTNITHLTVADAASRQGESALRSALGASQWDLLKLHAADSAVIGVCGGALALAIAALTAPALVTIDPAIAQIVGRVRVDWRVTAAAVLMALLLSFFARAIPAFVHSRGDLVRRFGIGQRSTAARSKFALIACESAFAFVLLVGGLVLATALGRLSRANTGYDPDHVLVMQLRIAESRYATTQARGTYLDSILRRLETLPGVSHAGGMTGVVGPGNSTTTQIHIEGQPTEDGHAYGVQFRRISPGYFAALRAPIVQGRDVARQDGADAPPVAIVNAAFAKRFWAATDPLDHRVRRTGADIRWYTVVGVVADIRDADLSVDGQPTLYIPYAQNNTGIVPLVLAVRTEGQPAAIARSVRGAIAAVDPLQPIDRMMPLADFLSSTLGPQRFRSMLVSAFAIVGLALAIVGIYGVTARAVQERTREVAIRVALGARRGATWWMMMSRSLSAVAAGVAVGIAISSAGAGQLFQAIGVSEPPTGAGMTIAAAALLATALAAAAWPARRATSVEPAIALRIE